MSEVLRPRAGRAPVSLRDGIVATAELRAFDPAEAALVLQFLGMPRDSVEPPSPPSRPEVPPPQPGTPTPRAPERIHDQPLKAGVVSEQGHPRRSTLSPLGTREVPRPAWLSDVQAIQSRAREATRAMQPPPIFQPTLSRAIFSAALATWVEEGEFDLPRVVHAVAYLHPLRVIPRTMLRTLRRGVHLLLDTGPGMEPFEDDLARFEVDLTSLLSSGQVERFYFSQCPGRGVRHALQTRRLRWRAPPRGMPVLILSDFGLSGSPFDEDRASVVEWQRFIREVHADGHPVVGLTPVRPSRWPVGLAEALTLIHWAERTAASTVDRTVRTAQRRR